MTRVSKLGAIGAILILLGCETRNFADTSSMVEANADTQIRYSGPAVSEDRRAFLDHRYWVELRLEDEPREIIIEGYLNRVSANSGEWVANLGELSQGRYRVTQKFCVGPNVALEGCEGRIVASSERIVTTEESVLRQSQTRYLQTPNGSVFIKSGAGSPENILAYAGFDNTYDVGGTEFPALGDNQLHEFLPHLRDARPDDPTWKGGRGASLLGLFNYYEEVGVNSQYLVAMNVEGDGQDVFPWVSHDDPYVYDVSKLTQWQTALEHANRRGVAINFLFTETENESLFEVHDGMDVGVDFAPSRKLYYREIVARFGHLPLLIWNLGEENGVDGTTGSDPYRAATSPTQRMAFTDHIAALDGRDHPIVSHNYPFEEEPTYTAKLGHPSFSGISLQAHENYFDKAAEWTRRSAEAGQPWMVGVDEPLGWEFGARPDADVDRREEILTVLWPSLLGGAAGVEWYFGWQNNAPTSDLSSEDQRTRDQLWRDSAQVRRFFETLPLTDMNPRRDGDTMILEGAGHRLEMRADTIVYTAPNQPQRQLDPFNPA